MLTPQPTIWTRSLSAANFIWYNFEGFPQMEDSATTMNMYTVVKMCKFIRTSITKVGMLIIRTQVKPQQVIGVDEISSPKWRVNAARDCRRQTILPSGMTWNLRATPARKAVAQMCVTKVRKMKILVKCSLKRKIYWSTAEAKRQKHTMKRMFTSTSSILVHFKRLQNTVKCPCHIY